MKKRWVWVAAVMLVCSAGASADFLDDFTGSTLRIDYQHTGTASEEHFALGRVRIEGPWPGSRTQLIDSTNLGKYRVEVFDPESDRLLYSRGFASIFGEWETTGEARREVWRAIPEAVRIPEPRRPFQVRLHKRQPDQSFSEVWTVSLDPTSRFVDRPPLATGDVRALLESGSPARKVDLVILGDGYTANETDLFVDQARELMDALFEIEPFRTRRSDFNVWAVVTPAEESGISRPRAGVFRDSPLGTRYNTFDAERYVLTLDDRAWRDVAAAVTYDFALILVNERKYGGGGIFGLYSTAAASSGFAPYLVVHEFGHHFAGLGDEYYTSDVAYEEFAGQMIEPWEPNITALLDPRQLKWGDLVSDGTPLPTPWIKETFENHSRASQAERRDLRAQGAPEEQLEELFRAEQDRYTEMLGNDEYTGRVGAFEGAMYEPQGLYRPTVDCIMFTRDEVGFCPVCGHAIEQVIDLYTK